MSNTFYYAMTVYVAKETQERIDKSIPKQDDTK
jgi:hypothetical protein